MKLIYPVYCQYVLFLNSQNGFQPFGCMKPGLIILILEGMRGQVPSNHIKDIVYG